MVRYITESRRQRQEREAREAAELEERNARKSRRLAREKQVRQEHKIRQQLIKIRSHYINGSSSNDNGNHEEPMEEQGERKATVDATDDEETEIDETPEVDEAPQEARPSNRRPNGNSAIKARRAELLERHQHDYDQDDDRFYVIEKLIDKRVTRAGVEEYKVRWQNYLPDYDTWEPRSEIEINALDMINDFNKIPQPQVNDEKHCICESAYKPGKGAMIQCSACLTWYHFNCLNLNLYEANCYADYFCKDCRLANPGLQCVVKQQKLGRLQGLTRMKVDKTSGVILESPSTKQKK